MTIYAIVDAIAGDSLIDSFVQDYDTEPHLYQWLAKQNQDSAVTFVIRKTNLRSLVDVIWFTSAEINITRTEQQVFNQVVQEVGELATEIAVYVGDSGKEPGPDGVVGEAIDAINALVDLIRVHAPNITEADLLKYAHKKQTKWRKAVITKDAQ